MEGKGVVWWGQPQGQEGWRMADGKMGLGQEIFE